MASCSRPRPQVELLPPITSPTESPRPVQFPRDEAPHEDLTEWWYYTGHLQAADGREFGFEYVIFQTIRGDYPVLYLGQFAITDRSRASFRYVSKLAEGSQIGRAGGLDLALQNWRALGSLGQDRIEAAMDDYSIALDIQAQKPPVLHDGDGLVSFGEAGDSYYYSYTRMSVEGTLVDHGQPLAVRGQAWFDHQWGNFLVLGGGWDWFSAQLDDGSELMLNELRDDQDRVVGVWGTFIDADGAYRVLNESDFKIRPIGSWTSPRSGGTYPMGWSVSLSEPAYDLQFTPVLEDQELFSEQGRAPTYWEGASDIHGTVAGRPVRGKGYVELTGYAKK